MKNAYCITDDCVSITVNSYHDGPKIALIDVADLPLMDEFRGTWYAHPARAPKGKFYVFGKRWDAAAQKSTTISLHRLIMGYPKHDVHHKDNDGLNCLRSNMETLTHQQNIRAQWPDRDWAVSDETVVLAEEYRHERALAKTIQDQFGLARITMYKIRTGIIKHSPAAEAYHEACKAAGIKPFELIKGSRPRGGKWGAMRAAQALPRP